MTQTVGRNADVGEASGPGVSEDVRRSDDRNSNASDTSYNSGFWCWRVCESVLTLSISLTVTTQQLPALVTPFSFKKQARKYLLGCP